MAYVAVVGGMESNALAEMKARKVRETEEQALNVMLSLVREHAASMRYAYRFILVNVERTLVRQYERIGEKSDVGFFDFERQICPEAAREP